MFVAPPANNDNVGPAPTPSRRPNAPRFLDIDAALRSTLFLYSGVLRDLTPYFSVYSIKNASSHRLPELVTFSGALAFSPISWLTFSFPGTWRFRTSSEVAITSSGNYPAASGLCLRGCEACHVNHALRVITVKRTLTVL